MEFSTAICLTILEISIKIIFSLFFLILLSTSISFFKSLYIIGFEYENFSQFLKSILFLRYFLMLVIIYLLIQLNYLNYKYFFISAAAVSILVSMDIIFQYIFGFNTIGMRSDHLVIGHSWLNYSYHSGFFGEELIAGGFIQRFAFFSVFFIPFIFRDKNILKLILTVATICIVAVGIMLSGNRMPLMLFLMGLFIAFFVTNKLRIIIPTSFLALFLVFSFLLSSNEGIKFHYSGYINKAKLVAGGIYNYLGNKKLTQDYAVISTEETEVAVKEARDSAPKLSFGDQSTHKRVYLAGMDVWKRNKIFGGGIKSFGKNCIKLKNENPDINFRLILEKYYIHHYLVYEKNRLCSNHPHNYYLELLTDTGIVGSFITILIAFLFVFFVIKNLKYFNENKIEIFLLLSAIVSLSIELFPIRSSGSIFTTNNTTYIMLMASIIISYKKLINNKN